MQNQNSLINVASIGNLENLDYLLEQNNNFDQVLPYYLQSQLDLAILQCVKNSKLQSDHKQCVRTLLRYKANPNTVDQQGTSLLMMAAEKGDYELVKVLIDNNCDINIKNNQDKNALNFSVDNNNNSENVDIIKLLLQNNIQMETPQNQTPLMKSVQKNYLAITKQLLSSGANPNVFTENHQDNPLQIAARHKNLDMVKILINYYDNISHRNKQNQTVFDLTNDENILQVLRNYEEQLRRQNQKDINIKKYTDQLMPIKIQGLVEFILDKKKSMKKGNYKKNDKKIDKQNFQSTQEFFNNQIQPQEIYEQQQNLNNDISIELDKSQEKQIEYKIKQTNIKESYSSFKQDIQNPVIEIFLRNELEFQNLLQEVEFDSSNKFFRDKQKILEELKIQLKQLEEQENSLKQEFQNKEQMLIQQQKQKQEFQNQLDLKKQQFQDLEQIQYQKLDASTSTSETSQGSKILDFLYDQNGSLLIPQYLNQFNQPLIQTRINQRIVQSNSDDLINTLQFHNIIPPEQIAFELHQEILDFQLEIETFNSQNQDLFNQLIQKIKDIVINKFPLAQVDVYGSFASELCLPWSDIDIVIQAEGYNQSDILSKVDEGIKEQDWVINTNNIQQATVPVLKVLCSEKFLKKKIDITIQQGNHQGIKCVELVKKFLAHYMTLKPLVLVLKQFIFSANLNDTFKGGLSSYGLILMIVSFLQNKIQQLSLRANQKITLDSPNLGILLLDFLKWYGIEMNYSQQEIIAYLPDSFVQSPNFSIYVQKYNFKQQPFFEFSNSIKLNIRDPLNPNNNVGRSTFKLLFLKWIMSQAYVIICMNQDCQIHFNKELINYQPGYDGPIKKRSCCILKRLFYQTQNFSTESQ